MIEDSTLGFNVMIADGRVHDMHWIGGDGYDRACRDGQAKSLFLEALHHHWRAPGASANGRRVEAVRAVAKAAAYEMFSTSLVTSSAMVQMSTVIRAPCLAIYSAIIDK